MGTLQTAAVRRETNKFTLTCILEVFRFTISKRPLPEPACSVKMEAIQHHHQHTHAALVPRSTYNGAKF